MRLLARVATRQTNADVFALLDSPGWATLVTILGESGEQRPSPPPKSFSRPSKRPPPPAALSPRDGYRPLKRSASGADVVPTSLARAVAARGEVVVVDDDDDDDGGGDANPFSALAEKNTLAKRVKGVRLDRN